MAPEVTALTSRLPLSNCPKCGMELDAAVGLEPGVRPNPGDVSVCSDCGTLLMFTNDAGLRAMEDEEEAAFTDEESQQVHLARKVVATLALQKARASGG